MSRGHLFYILLSRRWKGPNEHHHHEGLAKGLPQIDARYQLISFDHQLDHHSQIGSSAQVSDDLIFISFDWVLVKVCCVVDPCELSKRGGVMNAAA
jgi:hypothetical protein